MLVLTRKIGEKVMIGDEVTVTVLGMFGNHVRLGITAPKTSACIAKKFGNESSMKRRTKSPRADRSFQENLPTEVFFGLSYSVFILSRGRHSE